MCGTEDKSGGIGIALKSNRDNGKGKGLISIGENGEKGETCLSSYSISLWKWNFKK